MRANGGNAQAPRRARGRTAAHGQEQTAEATVAGHNRPGVLRSIRIRMLLPVVLAAVGLVLLGVIQTGDALGQSRAGQEARVLARASNAVVALVHQVQQEYVETNALHQRGGTAGAELLAAQRRRTDTARTRYFVASRAARDAVPALGPALTNADAYLDLIPSAREIAMTLPEGSSEVRAIYRRATAALLAVADVVPGRLTDPQLVQLAQSMTLVAELEELATEQLDVLRRAFTREQLPADQLVRLAGLAGAEQLRLEELERVPGPALSRYDAQVRGEDVERAKLIRDTVLDVGGDPNALQVDPDVWYVAQSGRLRRLRLVEIQLAEQLEQTAYEVEIGAQRTAAVIGALTLGLVAIALAAATVLAVRTSRRLRKMRQAALSVARAELPNAITRVTAASDAVAVRGTLQDASTRIDSMLTRGSDEIGELASAFGAVHRQALRLAADQALMRMDVEATLVGLSRRGQTLVQRQLQILEQYGSGGPLNHLAARMRRNEENLLVLGGGEPGRRFNSPVPLLYLMRAAAEEIEDYHRIDALEIPPVAVTAAATGDVIHLLAELLENAANFSPPSTSVRVSARPTMEGMTITVYDEGIGMPPAKLAEANQRLAQPSALTSSLVGTMGLLVVARLAERHGIQVRLHSSPGAGTAATVTLPAQVLASAPPDSVTFRALGVLPALPDNVVQAAVIAPPVPVRLSGAPELPRRGTGSPVRTLADSGSSSPPGALDPETVRARLSSLASGIAAANRRSATSPASTPGRPTQTSPS